MPLDEDSWGSLFAMIVGSALFLFALSLPMFGVTFAPPHGKAMVNHEQVEAFHVPIRGWDFAKIAPSARIEILVVAFVLVLAGRVIVFVVQRFAAPSTLHFTGVVLKWVHTGMAALVAFAWLALFALLVLLEKVHHPGVEVAMPSGGKAGFLAALHHPWTHTKTYESPYLTVGLGIGWALLMLGLLICMWSMWQVAAVACVLYVAAGVAAYVVHKFVHGSRLDAVAHWINAWRPYLL